MGKITPYLEITGISYGDGPAEAGTDFECTVTVTVSDGDEAIENAVVSLTLPYGLTFAKPTDRVYLGTLQPGYSYNAVFLLHVDRDIRQSTATVEAYISGVSSLYGIPMEMREDVQIAVRRAERIEIRELVVPSEVNAAYDDGSGRISFTLANQGETDIKDIEITVTGEGFLPAKPVSIEGIPSLSEEAVTVSVMPEDEGDFEGTLCVSYTSDGGSRREIKEPVKIHAFYQQAGISHDVIIDPAVIQPEPVIPDWVWAAATFGAIVGLIIILRKLRRVIFRSERR